jgi:ABC-type oligopeptide transport system ATPase subunit
MGKTGSGKSTLSLLLTRLYDYTSGSIKIDGVELKDIQKAYLRRNIVPVLQDPFLFSKSISENILMANKKASKDEVRPGRPIADIMTPSSPSKMAMTPPSAKKACRFRAGKSNGSPSPAPSFRMPRSSSSMIPFRPSTPKPISRSART